MSLGGLVDFHHLDLAVEARAHPLAEYHKELEVDDADEGGRQVEPNRRRKHRIEEVLEGYKSQFCKTLKQASASGIFNK